MTIDQARDLLRQALTLISPLHQLHRDIQATLGESTIPEVIHVPDSPATAAGAAAPASGGHLND